MMRRSSSTPPLRRGTTGSGLGRPTGVASRAIVAPGIRRQADEIEGDDVTRALWDEPPMGPGEVESETPYQDNKP